MQSPRGCLLGCELTCVESPGPAGLGSDPRASDDPCLGVEALQVGGALEPGPPPPPSCVVPGAEGTARAGQRCGA